MDVDGLSKRLDDLARYENIGEAAEAAAALRELQGERDRARRSASILPKLDCRYTGTGLSDIDGSHCSLTEPCQRCRLERERDALKAENEKLLGMLIEAQDSVRECYNQAVNDPLPRPKRIQYYATFLSEIDAALAARGE